jgi:hypothetical protein
MARMANIKDGSNDALCRAFTTAGIIAEGVLLVEATGRARAWGGFN